jgi:signal transduction histidine kinase/CheY-like chemotaxis protein
VTSERRILNEPAVAEPHGKPDERPNSDERILVLAPTGRDAALISEMLGKEHLSCAACQTVESLAIVFEAGAGMAILAEEALLGVSVKRLITALQNQPAWSDFPLLFLTTTGAEASGASKLLLSLFGTQANVTIMERPVRVATLLSSVRSSLRARRRQYEVRDYMAEQKRGEEKLLQTQKLESLGVLAGGVAHDFNNLLTGILGNASLALHILPGESPARSMLEDVIAASDRAAHLTKQLLAYAGKGRFIVRQLDLSDTVRDVSHLIQSSIPKNVHLELDLAPLLPSIEADAAQVQQIIMNLVINAAEAIPADRNGDVVVNTRVRRIDEAYIRRTFTPGEIATGEYVILEVHDNGTGMDESTIERIFEPFFSTKFTGRGLGLAAVLGIVRGHHGALKVYSEPKRGSTFLVLFPASEKEAAEPQPVRPAFHQIFGRGGGTILVIDDEEVVRRTAKSTLERAGYDIVVAEGGREGVEVFRALANKVALVLLDLTMPDLNGEEVLRRLKQIRPDIKVVLSSGYNEMEVIQRFTGKGLAGFIQKPYASSGLTETVDRALKE